MRRLSFGAKECWMSEQIIICLCLLAVDDASFFGGPEHWRLNQSFRGGSTCVLPPAMGELLPVRVGKESHHPLCLGAAKHKSTQHVKRNSLGTLHPVGAPSGMLQHHLFQPGTQDMTPKQHQNHHKPSQHKRSSACNA